MNVCIVNDASCGPYDWAIQCILFYSMHTIYESLIRHEKAEILLKLALNTNQSMTNGSLIGSCLRELFCL